MFKENGWQDPHEKNVDKLLLLNLEPLSKTVYFQTGSLMNAVGR